MQVQFLKFISLALAIFLGGCSGLGNEIKKEAAVSDEQIQARRAALIASIASSEQRRVAAQDVQRPFIAGASRPLARDVMMPELLRQNTPVTTLFSRNPVDLQTAAQQLSQAVGVTVAVTPDALLPPAAFAPKTGAQTPIQPPARVVMPSQSRPLWSTLDDIARQASVHWRVLSANSVEFYRVETRVFNISAIPQVTTTAASLGRNAGTNSVFDSQSKSSFETKDQNLLRGLGTAIDALLSVSGKATLAPESQTVVVTDSKESLDRVEAFIKDQNRAMSMRVRVLIEAIEVTDKNSSEFGVDWTLIFQRASESLRFSPLTSLTTAQAAGLGYSQLDANNPFNGSAALIKSLSEVGIVVNRRSFPFLTTSGRPVTQALRTTFSYIDQVQTSSVASSSTTATAPTVTQKDETVGTFVTLVPTAKPDGTIFLSVSFDVTSAAPLVPFTVGSGSSGVTVQQKTIDGSGVIQEVPVRSGQTVVIGGIEQDIMQSTERRLGPNAPIVLGGSNNSKTTKSRMILLVTAVAEEGI